MAARRGGHRDGSSHQEDLGKKVNVGLVVELGFDFYLNEGSWDRISKSNTSGAITLHGFWFAEGIVHILTQSMKWSIG